MEAEIESIFVFDFLCLIPHSRNIFSAILLEYLSSHKITLILYADIFSERIHSLVHRATMLR